MKTLKQILIPILLLTLFVSCDNNTQSPGTEYMPDMYRSPAVDMNYNAPDDTKSFNGAVLSNTDGKALYENYCIMCHGENGQGNGLVPNTGKFPPPPAYKADLTVDYIYQTVNNGKGAMPSYSYQLNNAEMLMVSEYILTL